MVGDREERGSGGEDRKKVGYDALEFGCGGVAVEVLWSLAEVCVMKRYIFYGFGSVSLVSLVLPSVHLV